VADSTVSISADLSALRRELAQIPNLTDENAQKMLAKLERSVRAAEKAARASTKATSKALQQAAKDANKAESAVGEFGGQLARLGGMTDLFGEGGTAVTRIGDAFELLSSPVGVAVAGVVAFTGALSGAVVAIQSVDESTERLRELGYASQLTGTQLVEVGAAASALDAVEAAALRLGQTFAASAAPGVESMATSTANLLASLDPMAAAVGRYTGSLAHGVSWMTAFVEVMGEATGDIPIYADMLSFGTAPLFAMIGAFDQVTPRAVANTQATREMGEAAQKAAALNDKLVYSLDDQKAALQALGLIETDAEGAAREAAARDAKARAVQGEAAAQRELADALRTIQGITDQATPALEGIELTYAKIDAVNALAMAHVHSADVQAAAQTALQALVAQGEQQAAEIYAAEVERAAGLREAQAQAQAASAAYVAWADTAAAQLVEIRAQAVGAIAELGMGTAGDLAGGVADLANALADSGKLNEKAAVQAYKIAKGAGLAQVAISTAVAAAKALELGPIFGPIAAGAAVAAGAAQAVAIQSTPPPSFFVGGGPLEAARHPDATAAILHRGERVQPAASARRDDRGDMRAAMSGTAAPAPMTIQVMYGGRALDTVVSSESQRPGSALRKATGTPRLGARTR